MGATPARSAGKGGRHCETCQHPDRQEVEAAIIAGGSFRDVAGQFGRSKTSLQRHAATHIPEILSKARAVRERVTGDVLLDRLEELTTETREILADARAGEAHEVALKAINRLERQLELQARLLGELRDGATVNLVLSPEWTRVRTALLGALRPFPEAARAVAGALGGLDAGG